MKQPSNIFGRRAILVALLAFLFFFAPLGNLAVGYFTNGSSATDLRLIIWGGWAALALSLGGLVLSVMGFFRRKERKGLPVVACILSALLLVLSGALIFSYHYMFHTLGQDESFNPKELHIATPKEDGSLELTPVPPEQTVSEEEVKKQLQKLELGHLVDETAPKEALAYMDRYDPVCYSVLLPGAENIRNYLLFGLDEVGSSDSILLISLDSLHKKVKMISLPRDSYAYLPQWGIYTKLTYAHSYGGASMAVGTVNYNLSMNVTDYVSVRLNDVEKMIDLVGGVTVNMGYAEWNYMTQCRIDGQQKFANLNQGPCHLDGEAAVYYMRLRETDTEIRRMERQREVLNALYQAALALPIEKYPELVRTGMELCSTSFDSYTLLSLMLEAIQGGYTLEQHGLVDLIPYWSGSFGPPDSYYLVFDWDHTADTLYRLIYEDYYVSGYSDLP